VSGRGLEARVGDRGHVCGHGHDRDHVCDRVYDRGHVCGHGHDQDHVCERVYDQDHERVYDHAFLLWNAGFSANWNQVAFSIRPTSRGGGKEVREPDRNVLMYLRTGSAGPTQSPGPDRRPSSLQSTDATSR
jgi:hypothetical protein